MTIAEKEFVLKHVFEHVSSMKRGDVQVSNTEEHFGVPWHVSISRVNGHGGEYLSFHLGCSKSVDDEKKWSIACSQTMKVCSASSGAPITESCNGVLGNVGEKAPGYGYREFMDWKRMKKDYTTDDNLTVEVHVKITKMTGIEMKKLRNFDESNKSFSDVVLVVEDQKFYVSKLFLANQSSYFNSLLFGNFEESKQEEVTLNDIDAEDFQRFLEVLYGALAINDESVIGILHLADMYDAKTVITQCEEFLVKESGKSPKAKLELAAKYKFEKLKNKCLLEIKTIDDIRSVLPDDTAQMDHDVLASLLDKAVSFYN